MSTTEYQTLDVGPREPAYASRKAQQCLLITTGVSIIVTIGLAISLALVLTNKYVEPKDIDEYVIPTDSPKITESYRKKLFAKVDKVKLKEHLHVISKQLHLAGTPANEAVQKYLIKQYSSFGYDVRSYAYNVMLTYPNFSNPNTVLLLSDDANDTIISDGCGAFLGPTEALQQESFDPNVKVQWHGYGALGTAQGPIVYANFGTIEDFLVLEKLNISVNGAIVLVRYGNLWRGAKVLEAQRRGAVGVIIYSDPQQYAPGSEVFPNTKWLPPEAAQRGSVINSDGDPATPELPSKGYVSRTENPDTLKAKEVMMKIPSTPISYAAAKKIFENMDGPLAPAEFKGTIKGIKYRLTSNSTFELNVHGKVNLKARIKNICAWHRGTGVDADDVVIFGNHYDAWTNGAIDPNSGTIVGLEFGRSLMSTINETKWRPKRSMAICHWDAEEYSLVGSIEFVQEMTKVLSARAVAVINVDVGASGNETLSVDGMPTLYNAVIEAAKTVLNPNLDEVKLGRQTVYDGMSAYAAQLRQVHMPGHRLMGIPGSGSDHYGFMAIVGVPVLDISYQSVKEGTSNPLYHTLFEVPWLIDNIIDSHYNTLAAVTQVTLEVARQLLSDPIVPIDLNGFAAFLPGAVDVLDATVTSEYANLPVLKKQMDSLNTLSNNLAAACLEFSKRVQSVQAGAIKATEALAINRRLNQFERSFISSNKLYSGRRDSTRHVIFGKSQFNSYKGNVFPAVSDIMNYIQLARQKGDKAAIDQWQKELITSINNIMYALESARISIIFDGF